MPDSLHHIVDTLILKQNENYDLLNKVDTFYQSAWTKLMISGSISFAIIGIIVPLILQWYQRKIALDSINVVKSELKSELVLETEKQRNIMDTLLKEYEVKIEEKIIRLRKSTSAQTFHLQGVQAWNDKQMVLATKDFIQAANLYSQTKDDLNLKTILNALIEVCSAGLKKDDISQLELRGIKFERLFQQLQNSKNPLLTEPIISLKSAYEKVKNS